MCVSEIDVVGVVAALADRDHLDHLMAFAAMVLSCDRAVRAARMDYDGVGERYQLHHRDRGREEHGMSVAAARQALEALEVGLATSDADGDAWRADAATLAGLGSVEGGGVMITRADTIS